MRCQVQKRTVNKNQDLYIVYVIYLYNFVQVKRVKVGFVNQNSGFVNQSFDNQGLSTKTGIRQPRGSSTKKLDSQVERHKIYTLGRSGYIWYNPFPSCYLVGHPRIFFASLTVTGRAFSSSSRPPSLHQGWGQLHCNRKWSNAWTTSVLNGTHGDWFSWFQWWVCVGVVGCVAKNHCMTVLFEI